MRYIGIIMMILGAIFLMLIAFFDIMPQSNVALVCGLGTVILGYVLHIFLDKRAEADMSKGN